ncbi:MAG: RNA 2',3'-cyclic phosphodiesterase [Chloroflexi bacterium]|nr:RNA 2',3'-cyclic phosphodiesterase [Chloroflexota bacterium]
MELIRSFIAIELPEELKESLTDLHAKLKQAGGNNVKWVRPEGVHLTLVFLGYVAAEKIPAVTEAMTRVAEGIAPLTLTARGVGAFPSWQRPRVVWVGLEGDIERLKTLQKRLQDALEPLGFTPEKRDFSPHLTLGRVREPISPAERRRMGEVMSAIGFETPVNWKVDSVSLMRSELKPTGAVYSQLASAKWLG